MDSKEKLKIIVGDDSAFKDIFGHLIIKNIHNNLEVLLQICYNLFEYGGKV